MIGWLLLAALAAVVFAEVLARFLLRRSKRYTLVPHGRSKHELDATALPGLPSPVHIEINAEGERGGELPTRDLGTHRTLVIGGSAAECYMLDQPDAWPQQLEDVLKEARGPLGREHVHVGNVARSLLSCASLDRVLEGILPQYDHLDVLVTYTGASDVVAWLERGAPRDAAAELQPDEVLFPIRPDEAFGWTPGSSALRRLAVRLGRRFLHPVDHRTGVGRTLDRNRAMRAAATHRIDEVPDATAMLEAYERSLSSMVERAQRKGARVLLVQQPWITRNFTAEEDRRLWSFAKGRPFDGPVDTWFTHRVGHALLAAVDEVQQKVAERMGCDHLELQSKLPMDFEHWYDDLHLSPRGARLVAQEVGRAIVATYEREPRSPKRS